MRIFLLEDDENMSRVLTQMLVWMGHEVQRLERIDTLKAQVKGSSQSPAMVLVHVDSRESDVAYMKGLASAGCRDMPIVVISDRSDKPGSLAECPRGVAAMISPLVTVGKMQGVLRRILEEAGRIDAPCPAIDP